jgi:hypothetical protein
MVGGGGLSEHFPDRAVSHTYQPAASSRSVDRCLIGGQYLASSTERINTRGDRSAYCNGPSTTSSLVVNKQLVVARLAFVA